MSIFKNKINKELIYPGNHYQVAFWTRKWGITIDQLNEAIIETGSIKPPEIKNYLIEKGILFSISKLINHFIIRALIFLNIKHEKILL